MNSGNQFEAMEKDVRAVFSNEHLATYAKELSDRCRR